MLVLLILGLFGIKAALIVYGVYRCAKWLSDKGDNIKKGYETEIAGLKQENTQLRDLRSWSVSPLN